MENSLFYYLHRLIPCFNNRFLGEDVDLSTIKDEHVVAGCLKSYFRELPETIFTRKVVPQLKIAERTDLNLSFLT